MVRGVVLLALAAIFPLALHNTATTSAASTPIQHLIIIMQENHSFDNYFGTYPTANGTLVDATTSKLEPVDGIPNHTCLPYSDGCLSPQLTTSQEPSNPIEGQSAYEMDYSNNATGFPSHSGPQSMVYFDYHSLAAYWDYAEEYGLADNYFAAALSTTTPNRLMLLAGDSPVSANYGPPPYVPYSESVMSQLDNAGVTWGYYDYIDAYGGPPNVYPLNYFSDAPQSAFGNTRSVDTLTQELVSGTGLPSVSFASSLGRPELSEHPPYNPTTGELWVLSIVNKVMRSVYWSSTAILITWDEGGGYYDHVVPPNEFTTSKNFSDPLISLGERVPLLVISPYVKADFVSHTLLSHLSILHFIEYNWNLTTLTNLVAGSNLPLSFFNFSQQPRPPVILSSPSSYPIPLQDQSNGSSLSTPIYYPILLGSMLVVFSVLFVKKAARSTVRTAKNPRQLPRPGGDARPG